MINANELRIGNWVYGMNGYNIEHTKVPTKIAGVNWEEANLDFDDYKTHWCGVNWIDPIPLTPELLEKCGMTDKDIEGEVIDGGRGQEWEHAESRPDKTFAIREEEEGGYALLGTEPYWTIGKPFQFLHQLQNLYFALTGTELSVNLTADAGK